MAVSNVELRVDARNAVQALKRTNDASKKLNDTLKTTERRAATATGNIQRMGVSFRTTLGSVVALTGAVTFFSRSLNVLGERQADAAALANGLRKLGRGAADLERLQKAADELGKATLFDQEDFDRGFALLTSFQTIGVESYTRVAKAAADVAQVTKQDVNSSLLQLAKALQDPVRGLTALSRSGTTFTEQQKEQIKALVESGKQLEAQQFILAEIEKQYGDAAKEAGAAGYAGAVDSLGESFRDFQETIASAVEPTVVKLLGGMTDLFNAISKIPEPAARLALEIAGVTTAVVLLKKAVNAYIGSKLAATITTQITLMQAFGAQIYLTAAAQGALNTAMTIGQGLLAALPVAAVTLAVVGLADALRQAATDQANFNNLLNTGTVEQLENALATEKATLALERRFVAQGRGEGRAADRSRIERSQQKIKELEAALAEGMLGGGSLPLDQPEPTLIKTINTELDKTKKKAKDSKQVIGSLNLDAISYLQTAEETDRIQEEAGKQLADLINMAEDAGKAFAEDYIQRSTKAIEKAGEKMDNLYSSIGQSIQTGIVDSLTAAVEGTKSLADVASQTLRQVANILLQFGVNTALGGLSTVGGTGSIFSKLFGGFRASGGTVTGGRSYMVGEKGPELFTPGRTGSIAPSGSFGGANVVVNVDASGSQAQGNQPNAKALGSAIGAAVQAELVKQKRPGGLLA
ncbi:unnamed protein product [uncultured Mediterranean phage uvMED]|nr:unnamed protein product [uncultured Mediterranean phage uvMED]